MKNNYKLHILDLDLRTIDVLTAYTLKELAKLFCVYCQIHQEASYLMLYNGNENLTCKPEYFQWHVHHTAQSMCPSHVPPFLIFSIIHSFTVIINSVKDSILLLHPGFSGSSLFAEYPALHGIFNMKISPCYLKKISSARNLQSEKLQNALGSVSD